MNKTLTKFDENLPSLPLLRSRIALQVARKNCSVQRCPETRVGILMRFGNPESASFVALKFYGGGGVHVLNFESLGK